jgi:ribosomal protein S1
MNSKFVNQKFRLMDLPEDFDFNMEKWQKAYYAQNALLEKMYDGYNFQSPTVDDVVNSVYVGSTNDYLMFDGNFKDYIRIDNKPGESKYLKNTNIGDRVDVAIVDIEQDTYLIKGSLSTLYETRAHETLKSIEEDQHVNVLVKELTPAGYNVDINYEGVTLPGFMPNTLAGINKLYAVESILGKNLEVMIESYSRDEGTYIVSRRKYLQSLIPEAIKQLKRGEVYTGNVTGTTPFGVFIEFADCLTGMIHKTNISPEWQDKISQIQPGTEIDFYIKEIIKDKIILTQILRESLWDSINIGQQLTGKVRDNKQFGTLIQLDDETIGLIHISELEKSGKKGFPQGEEVKVRVIAIDRSSRKIFLSVK